MPHAKVDDVNIYYEEFGLYPSAGSSRQAEECLIWEELSNVNGTAAMSFQFLKACLL